MLPLLELLNAVEPFLNKGSTVLPYVPDNAPIEVAGPSTLSSFHLLERVDCRVVVPANTPFGEISTTVAPSFSVEGEVSQEDIWLQLQNNAESSTHEIADNIAIIVRNHSAESSLRQRLNAFDDNSVLLMGKTKGDYWGEVDASLRKTSTQAEYAITLDFEQRDMVRRELLNDCINILKEELALCQECDMFSGRYIEDDILSFLEQQSEDLEGECWSIDHELSTVEKLKHTQMIETGEIVILRQIKKDLIKNGGDSYYFNESRTSSPTSSLQLFFI